MRFGMGYGAWTGGPHGMGGRGRVRGGEEGGHGRRRMFDGSELKLLLLRLIADQPRHGYELIKAIEERTGGAYAPSPGVVYPTLTMLGEMDLIAQQESEGAKKLFAVTANGEAHLAEQESVIEGLFGRLEAIGAHRARTEGGSVRRAMGNLKQVLLNRLGGQDVSEESLHEIVAIIDDAAQRIERLK
jgi:DNA-binding PadR family transcriptional regulator